MNKGYIKLWRKSIEAGWLTNHKLWVLWSWCLMKASHKELDIVVGCQQIHLIPGEFVFGLKAAAKETNISIQSIRTLLNFLKTSQNLTIKPTNKFSIISILNWDTYQNEENEINTQTNKQLTNNQQTTNNKQECKEHKNINNNIYRGKFSIPTIEEITSYCKERNNTINPQTFIDHYTGNGWMVGKNKMKDWKAVIRTWETRGGNYATGNVTTRMPIRTERDANNQAGLDEADLITREWEAKKAAANGHA